MNTAAIRKYPIGIQSFEKLRSKGFLYIDKMDSVYHLAASGVSYFLSRPRRFGKSLLLSTLKKVLPKKFSISNWKASSSDGNRSTGHKRAIGVIPSAL